MSNNEDEVKIKLEAIVSESEIQHSVPPNLHKRVQTAEGWRRSVKRTRKSSKTTSKS